MPRAWELAFDEAVVSLAGLRRDIVGYDVHALSTVGGPRHSVLRARASTHVWLAAVMERFVNAWVAGMCVEFNSVGVRWCDTRVTMFPMARGSEIQALVDGVKKDAWGKKMSLFVRTVGTERAIIDPCHSPLDGKTIRSRHLEDIWATFGLTGPAFPSPMHRFVLEAVADYRNELAHGTEVPAVIGAKLTYADVVRYVDKFDDMVEHCTVAAESYFHGARYLR